MTLEMRKIESEWEGKYLTFVQLEELSQRGENVITSVRITCLRYRNSVKLGSFGNPVVCFTSPKRGLVLSQILVYFYVNWHSFSNNRLCTRPRFEKEVKKAFRKWPVIVFHFFVKFLIMLNPCGVRLIYNTHWTSTECYCTHYIA